MPDLRSRLDAALSHRYQLERELGRGGMATVWLARDVRHGRRVALKVLHPELAATVGPERFLREIEIAASLAHPHILPLHESGEADGFLYYVMPHVDGESLRDRLSREIQLPVEDAIRIAREVADALGYAHARGLIHRDIKPENILLEAGHAVVADFGVARAIASAEADALTATGMAVGTPAYMSPEQAGGSARLDGRSDIYSLGCVLYEMLAGEPPFSAPTPQALAAKHLNATPPAVRVTRATVPAGVERVIERALAKVPADRFATSAEFGRALNPEPAPADGDARRASHVVPAAIFWRKVALGALAAASIALVGRHLARSQPAALDANRVVVFPLRTLGAGQLDVHEGDAVATYIGYALDGSEPLRWLDGWDYLGERERAGLRPISAEIAQRIARSLSAKYYLDGSIVQRADSVAVVLRLHDVAGDSVVSRAGSTAARSTADLPQLGLQAVSQLLPGLLAPGRPIDLSAFSERKPAAVAAFLQGEREYRRLRFGPALALYQEAVKLDSALVIAALRGVQAALWQEVPDQASQFSDVLQERDAMLAPRDALLARGLRYYLSGTADSAERLLQSSLEVDSIRTEAWFALGEVYNHLLPRRGPLDSLARAAFQRAEQIDSLFTPALFHLAQDALRDGNLSRGRQLIGRLELESPGSSYLDRLGIMFECVSRGPESIDWPTLAKAPEAILSAARAFSVGGKQTRCAERAFRAAFESDSSNASERWGALLGLQGLLAAGGRYAEVQRLLDSERALGLGSEVLYLVLAAAGHPLEARAGVVAAGAARGYSSLRVPNLWAHGLWATRSGNVRAAAAIDTALRAKVDSSGRRRDSLIARAHGARVVLLTGDSARAGALLDSLNPSAPTADLEWQPWEALGSERIAQADLLRSQGNYAGALRVASQFDSPTPVIYQVYLAASLVIRIRAAEGLSRTDLADSLRTRLLALRSGIPGERSH